MYIAVSILPGMINIKYILVPLLLLFLARSVPEAVPLNDDLVRIIDYRQKWILQPQGNKIIHITGFADPAGDVPAWIVNMAITDTPLNILRAVKKTLNK